MPTMSNHIHPHLNNVYEGPPYVCSINLYISFAILHASMFESLDSNAWNRQCIPVQLHTFTGSAWAPNLLLVLSSHNCSHIICENSENKIRSTRPLDFKALRGFSAASNMHVACLTTQSFSWTSHTLPWSQRREARVGKPSDGHGGLRVCIPVLSLGTFGTQVSFHWKT